ncbi:MAG: S1/P1 nuclease [Candidatus Korobacteraceae bacterium]
MQAKTASARRRFWPKAFYRNLHGLWDTSMILHTGLKRAEYAERLESLIKADNLASLAVGTPEQWANESLRVARTIWVQDNANLGDSYYDENIERLDRQMALAGLRLAKLLNDTLGKMTPADFR